MPIHPKISLITPSYNQGQYIEQTIDSVLSQDYPNLEYIIIDGGSTDNSVDIIKKYEKYLKYWVSEPDRGHCHAINKGLKHCTGTIFNWLNSDDYYEPDALHQVAAAFMAAPALHLVGGRERAFFSDTNETVSIYEGTKIDGDIYELIYQGIIDQPATFWKMDLIRQLGELPEGLHYTMDSYWWTKYLLMYGTDHVQRINDLLTNFRLHNASKSVANQHKFDNNRFAIRLSLAKRFNFNQYILDYLQANTDIMLPEALFQSVELGHNIDLNRLEANFALKAYPRYYMKKDYAATNELFEIAFKYYKTKKTIVDYIKLRVLPKPVLEKLRN